MSILDMFRTTPTPAPVVAPVVNPADQTVVPPNQGNIPAVSTVVVDPVTGLPVVAPVPEVKDESPLAPFNSLWETVPVDPNAPKDTPAYVAPTAEQMQKLVTDVDFSSKFTPEQLASVTAGGEEGTAALVQLLNTVGRESLVNATMVSTKLNEQAMSAAIAAQVAKMPGLVRAQTVKAHLTDTDPLFDNPAIKPFIEASQLQLQTKFPNATPAQITEMTQDYVKAMGEHFAPKPVVAAGTEGDDWTNYLEKG